MSVSPRHLRAVVSCVALAVVLIAQPHRSSADEPPAASSPVAKSRRSYVVAALGDSLSDPRSGGGKYLDPLRAACPKSRFDAYGVGGNMTNMMRRRLLRDVFGEGTGEPRPAYTHVLVLGGVNDVLSNRTAKRSVAVIERDLSGIYEAIEARGARVVAMTLSPWAGFRGHDETRHAMTIELNAWLRARPEHVDAVVDLFPILGCGEPATLCRDDALNDGLHWSKRGHVVVGEALKSSIFSDCE